MSAVLLPHVAFAREVLDDPSADLSHPFLRRAQMAALPAVAAESLIEAPTFLMDLGLRRWRDPSILFDGTLEQNPKLKARWAKLSEDQEQQLVLQARAWETGDYSTPEICADLETLVMFTGDNRAGYHLAQLLTTAVRPVDSCRLAIALGTMFSIEDPAESLRMFKRAAELSRDDRAAFLIGLRQVALFVKRLRDYPAARDLIHQLHAAAWQSRVVFLVSDADASALEALLRNLRALLEVREDVLPGALRPM
ncbi:MAG: hypothetical protein LBM66_06690, partial [Bifidobacteriaceae bacterium]|nr:hypothetical protein [Bifidobacteriaceae bacterium]